MPRLLGDFDGINRSQGHHSLNSFVVKLFQFGVQPFLEGKDLTFLSCFCFVLFPIHFPYSAFRFKGSHTSGAEVPCECLTRALYDVARKCWLQVPQP